MGAWIEILEHPRGIEPLAVAPYMGAWIEICAHLSLISFNLVAPYMGAWIEIFLTASASALVRCRTLYGCVD